jgi:NAD(P)-dependent dehydrogenase (short-subunit alcohol dehydrogenase family)
MSGPPWVSPDLSGRVAVVAGATRGAGRGIAVELGASGATVYGTGRTTRRSRSDMDRPETIEETAELVTAAGGTGIPVAVDHTVPEQVEALFQRVADEQDGRLDVLVNDVWGGDPLIDWGSPFWELDVDKVARLLPRAVLSHVITSRYGVPLLVARRSGLVVEVTDGDRPDYRGNLAYDVVKNAVIRLAFGMAEELRPHGVAAVALTPGFLRSEAMLEIFGVTEENWREGAAKDPHFIASETPRFVGRAVAALAGDAEILAKSGQVLSSWGLSDEYGFEDADGNRPHWGRYFVANVLGGPT